MRVSHGQRPVAIVWEGILEEVNLELIKEVSTGHSAGEQGFQVRRRRCGGGGAVGCEGPGGLTATAPIVPPNHSVLIPTESFTVTPVTQTPSLVVFTPSSSCPLSPTLPSQATGSVNAILAS